MNEQIAVSQNELKGQDEADGKLKQLNKLESAIWCLRGILAHQQSERNPNVEQIERTRERLRADVQKLTEYVEQEGEKVTTYSTHYHR